ncbi:hypothetical protein MBGDN05_00361 [Thermoplasmatales archaeon SCGC AB-539-N05]|nr:hypothetical protein MBGDN05_00361 [Thermoplasmatales archaeon SCGC AB-539-N05]ENO12058.1 hypothetical protein MBGDC06_00305 [Thermoplasmatales archaeon SCGC AB-539-C06]
MDDENKEDMTHLVQLFLKMVHIGFDELNMNERTEFVKLCGTTLAWGIDKFYNKVTSLEERIELLEET